MGNGEGLLGNVPKVGVIGRGMVSGKSMWWFGGRSGRCGGGWGEDRSEGGIEGGNVGVGGGAEGMTCMPEIEALLLFLHSFLMVLTETNVARLACFEVCTSSPVMESAENRLEDFRDDS